MTLKDKLPDRLKCSPLLTMESDSDIETIAESIVNLSDSDGDFFKKTEKLLLMACLGYLRDWCEPSQRTIGNLISLLDAALPKDNETHTALDNLFYEMKSGCNRKMASRPSGSLPPFPGATVSLRAIPMVLMCPRTFRSPAMKDSATRPHERRARVL